MNLEPKKIIVCGLLICGVFFAQCSVFASEDPSWQEFLNHYLAKGAVNYSAVKENPALFREAVSQIEKITAEEYNLWSSDAQKAFWINAYNLGAIKLVLDYYPLKRSASIKSFRYPANSIQQIPDVWNTHALNLLGENVSLNFIENEVLRKKFHDPRIHFAIVCASLGCPVLRDEIFVADRIDVQLNEATALFMGDSSKFKYDPRQKTFYLSPIFKWFKEDFVQAGGAIAFIKAHSPQHRDLPDTGMIRWLDYDWSLNDQKLK